MPWTHIMLLALSCDAAADLVLTKTVSSPTTVLNDEFSYNITVTNTAETAVAENALIIDVLPPGLVFVSSALPEGRYGHMQSSQPLLRMENQRKQRDVSRLATSTVSVKFLF